MNKRNQLNALKELLAQLKIHDPDIRKLIEQLSNKSYKSDEQKEIIRRLRIQNKKLIQQVALLKENILAAKDDRIKILNSVSHIKKLNTSLAEALGSCSTCWGEDPDCHNCKGKGIAGWKGINRRYFNIYVLSGLEKLYEQETT